MKISRRSVLHISGLAAAALALTGCSAAGSAALGGKLPGLLKGLTHGLPMPEAAKLGSVSASFALEKMGTQEHIYTPARFRERYEAVFGALPEGLLP